MDKRENKRTLTTACVVFYVLAVRAQAQNIDTARLFKLDSPAVVLIICQRAGSPIAEGSGVIVSKDGVILSALHVVQGGDSAVVRLKSGDVYDKVSVIAFDVRKDLVVLKIPGFDLPVLPLGNSNDTKEGDPVAMISNPKGLQGSITQGIVSAIRDMGEGYKVIQTTAAASPGSSGGAIFNANGELIAILSFKIVGGENLNFGIPVNYARGLLDTHESFPLTQLPRPTPAALPELWKSTTTGKEYRVKMDSDQLTAEWSNIPPEAAKQGAYIRSECHRSGTRWVGRSNIFLQCSLRNGKTKMCPIVLRFEIDSISADRITGGGDILREFDCGSCRVGKTGWGPFIWVPLTE